MRFWANWNHFDEHSQQAPVFLYLCGMLTCDEPDERLYWTEVGRQNNALLLSFEHRYYGDSHPYPDLSVQHLRHLTIKQALGDINVLIDVMNEYLKYRADWIIIGSGYGGALAAWFKQDYEQKALGAWSSSGTINAIKEFGMLDLNTYLRTEYSNDRERLVVGTGQGCSDAVKRAIDFVDDKLLTPDGKEFLKAQFGV